MIKSRSACAAKVIIDNSLIGGVGWALEALPQPKKHAMRFMDALLRLAASATSAKDFALVELAGGDPVMDEAQRGRLAEADATWLRSLRAVQRSLSSDNWSSLEAETARCLAVYEEIEGEIIG